MRMSDIYAARELVTQRTKLINDRDFAKFGHATVSISGRFLGQAFVDATSPAVVAVFDEMIASIDKQLRELGVDAE